MRDLDRFLAAQARDYNTALGEIARGRKETHWIWYVFPQIQGLGKSETAQLYGIRDVSEAESYIGHPVLGPRLRAIAELLLSHAGTPAREILGSPDDMKVRSCATLFHAAAPGEPVFRRILDAFYEGAEDPATLDRL
ncbi:DUF1810 domain-containing protein [Roseicyclus sp. F158]|uniref:DUF1810 domain-containing protein n=1 Tax=Tropicimonas omnivorans TaxID=3075590 RepID=A0ABU3DC14_9RHOB|nr:DUF1810 domain-containing protein [Roseicyclus sp. F158]MDT0681246.1 DUF1810 domain-containing protein [Roseicyclus sp. F158]